MISGHSCPLLRTRFPKAPAAFALVFSSSSESSLTNGPTAGRSASYSVGLWKPALPMAKHANFLQAQQKTRRGHVAHTGATGSSIAHCDTAHCTMQRTSSLHHCDGWL